MSKCLLCDRKLNAKITFTSIFFFDTPDATVCSLCLSSFEKIAEQHCSYCYKSGISEYCSDCQYWFSRGKHVDHRAIFQYNEAMADYFSRYKFQGDYLLRKVFAHQITLLLSRYPDYTIVPIPVSKHRMEERGFNQVEGLLEASHISYRVLLGKHESEQQSSKSRKERLEAEQVFYILDGVTIPDKLLLVDDIYTTGATFQHAVDLFMKMGEKEIKTFSLAR